MQRDVAAIADALHGVYLILFVLAAATLAIAWSVPPNLRPQLEERRAPG